MAFSEYKMVKGKLLDARLLEGQAYFFYHYVVNGLQYGGSSYCNPKKPADPIEVSLYAEKRPADTKEVEIEIYYHKDNHEISFIKPPTSKIPFDAIFLIALPIVYILVR
jgi:hypothetical protein